MVDPHEVSVVLAAFVIKLMQDSLRKKNPRKWLFGFKKEGNVRMFLPRIGDIYDTDINFFLDAIWRDRETFFEICIQPPTPGWSFALSILDEHMQCGLEDGMWLNIGVPPGIEPITVFDSEDEDQLSLLQMLCFRHALVAPADKQRHLSLIYLKIDAFRLAENEEYFICHRLTWMMLETYFRHT